MYRALSVPPVNEATLDRRIKSYSLAAAAAGVSVLALSHPADAKVVITNKNIPIPLCVVGFPCSVSIDLNGDGINDVKFSLILSYNQSWNSRLLTVAGQNGGSILGTAAGGKYSPYASCLLRGAKIGASDHFLRGKETMENSFIQFYSSTTLQRPPKKTLHGKWGGDHPNRFLGVKFKIDGKTHYGWIRVTVKPNATNSQWPAMSATITEYGYETVANKSLDAGLSSGADFADDQVQTPAFSPDHPSLGMLALGAERFAVASLSFSNGEASPLHSSSKQF
jgi:hypothetical protein